MTLKGAIGLAFVLLCIAVGVWQFMQISLAMMA